MSLVSPLKWWDEIVEKRDYLKKINPLLRFSGSPFISWKECRRKNTGYGRTNRMIQHLTYNHSEKRLVQKASTSAHREHLNENNPMHLFLAFFFTRVNIRFTQKRLFQLFYSCFFLFQCTGLDWLSLAGA